MIRITLREIKGSKARNLYFFDHDHLMRYIREFEPEKSDLDLNDDKVIDLVEVLEDFFNKGFYYPKFRVEFEMIRKSDWACYHATNGLAEEIEEDDSEEDE